MNKGLFFRLLSPWLYSLAVLFSAPALYAAERPHVYSGHLGKMPIVVELDLSDPDEISGRYFYRKYHHDLQLTGALDGQHLTLHEGKEEYGEKPRPQLQLDRTANGWQGQWQSPQGKRFAVNLIEQPIEEPPAGADPFWFSIYEQSPYEFLRLKELPLQPSKQQEFMGYTLRWWTEPVSKLSTFEVVSGYPETQRELINQQLRARLRKDVIAYHQCKLNGSSGWSEYSQKVTPRLLTADIVSLSIFTNYDCGGAHPDFGDAPLNLDARTGEPLELEDVLWLGDGKAFHYIRTGLGEDPASTVGFKEFSTYRNEIFAPWLVAELQKIAPIEMGSAAEVECAFSDPQFWDFPSWYFTEKGIYFDPIYPRVARACEGPEWSVLPYHVIKQHSGGIKLKLPD